MEDVLKRYILEFFSRSIKFTLKVTNSKKNQNVKYLIRKQLLLQYG